MAANAISRRRAVRYGLRVSDAVLCAPDKLRGSLSASAAAAALAAGARDAGLEALEHPLADGGEGTRDAIVVARGGRLVACRARDARGRERGAAYGLLDDGTAIVEAADAIGLGLLPRRDRDPLAATSAGLGRRCYAPRSTPGRGASSSASAAAPPSTAASASSPRSARPFLDADGGALDGSGADTERVARIDLAGLDPRIRDVELVVALDVTSPLAGPVGAARVFGPQKGADAAAVERLDAGLARLAPLYGAAAEIPGAGAAGGLGAALAFLGADAAPGRGARDGRDRLRRAAREAALCLTGEGSVDRQTATGRPSRARRGERSGGRAVLRVGGASRTAPSALYELGAGAVVAAGRRPQYARRRARPRRG